MAREPEAVVELRRVLGAQLAVCRVAAELTQDQVAHAGPPPWRLRSPGCSSR